MHGLETTVQYVEVQQNTSRTCSVFHPKQAGAVVSGTTPNHKPLSRCTDTPTYIRIKSGNHKAYTVVKVYLEI